MGQVGLYHQGSEAPSGGHRMFAAGSPRVSGPSLLRALMMLASRSLFVDAPTLLFSCAASTKPVAKTCCAAHVFDALSCYKYMQFMCREYVLQRMRAHSEEAAKAMPRPSEARREPKPWPLPSPSCPSGSWS